MPLVHRKLVEEILDSGGALVSQLPVGLQATSHRFAQRDRTQSGLSRGVVQSALDGGSLMALADGRWLAVPSPASHNLVANGRGIQVNVCLVGTDVQAKVSLLDLKIHML